MAIPRDIDVTLKALKANDFDAQFANTAEEARKIIFDMVPVTAKVGIADSVTLRQIGVLDELTRRGYEVNNPFKPENTQGMATDPARRKRFVDLLRQIFRSDVLITGSNAVTQDGNIVSIDAAGNRVAAIIYGAPHVILAVGRNKIVKDTAAAIDRIKNVIAPVHTAQKNYKTPCSKTGKCADCDSPQRICNVTVILEKQPYHTKISIVLINEDVGLGWDPAWEESRIQAIKANYIKYSWPF